MKRSTRVLLLVGAIAGNAPSAYAGLAAVDPAPNSPCGSNGFPKWITDTNGVTLDLPIPPVNTGVAGPNMIFAPITATSNLIAKAAGFDTEAFYYFARTGKDFTVNTGAKTPTPITATFGIEASYVPTNGVISPVAGAQVLFSRIRIKMPVKTLPATYLIEHPYGKDTVVVDSTNAKNGFYTLTKDFGNLAPGWVPSAGTCPFTPIAQGLTNAGFYQVLSAGSSISYFLRQLGSPNSVPVVNPPPLGWIGDGVSEGPVTGCVAAKTDINGVCAVRITAVSGGDIWYRNGVQTTNFAVSGHLGTTVPTANFSINRATRAFRNNQEYVDLFVTAPPVAGTSITIQVTTGSGAVQSGVVSALGSLYMAVPVTTATTSVTVTGLLPAGGALPSTQTVPVSDFVRIVAADYNDTTKNLSIKAISSDATDVSSMIATIPPSTTPITLTKDPTSFQGYALFSAPSNLMPSGVGEGPHRVSVTSVHQTPLVVGGQDNAPVTIVTTP